MQVIVEPKSVSFEASHTLPQFCATLHGHSYKARARVAGLLGEHGAVIDFQAVRGIVLTLICSATPPALESEHERHRQLAKIIADSISPHGVRLTTMEVVMPRIVLAEFNTHRMLTRSSASSRAIPIEKMLRKVIDDPYVPEQWDRNGAGMQGHGLIEGDDAVRCTACWLKARDRAVESAETLLALGVHKQTTNRLLEPFLWHTVIVTATEWSNFFNLRCHPAAHPAIRNTAEVMRDALQQSTPRALGFGQWHLPYVDKRDVELSATAKLMVSVARCARVSYLTHDGIRDPRADVDLHDRLLNAGHMSPFEHVARPLEDSYDDANLIEVSTGGFGSLHPSEMKPERYFVGNFRGWVQYRKTIPGEFDILAHQKGD